MTKSEAVKNICAVFDIILNLISMIFLLKMILFENIKLNVPIIILATLSLIFMILNILLEPNRNNMVFKILSLTFALLFLIIINRFFLINSLALKFNLIADFKNILFFECLDFVFCIIGFFNK